MNPQGSRLRQQSAVRAVRFLRSGALRLMAIGLTRTTLTSHHSETDRFVRVFRIAGRYGRRNIC
jgi:hypothetical protein